MYFGLLKISPPLLQSEDDDSLAPLISFGVASRRSRSTSSAQRVLAIAEETDQKERMIPGMERPPLLGSPFRASPMTVREYLGELVYPVIYP